MEDYKKYQPVPVTSPSGQRNGRGNIRRSPRNSTSSSAVCCCSRECLETLLIFCNILIWLLGAGLVALGVYLLINRRGYLAGLAGHIFFLSHYLLIGAGVIVVAVASLGCVSTLRKSLPCLRTHAALLFLLLLLQVAAGAIALVFGSQLEERVTKQLAKTMLNANFDEKGMPMKYSRNNLTEYDEQASFVDTLQESLFCCGSRSFKDWENSKFSKTRNATLAANSARVKTRPGEPEYKTVPDREVMKTPASCCRSREGMCARSTHPSNIYRRGCMAAVARRLQGDFFILVPVAFGVGFVQLLGLVLACALIQISSVDKRAL